MPTKEAFLYLKKYKGIDFLVEFYEIEHLQSIEDTLDDLILYCKKNGGHLSWFFTYSEAGIACESPAYIYELLKREIAQTNLLNE